MLNTIRAFELSCKQSKFAIGPVSFANPGPMLPRAVILLLNPIALLCSTIEIIKDVTPNIKK